MSTFKREDKMPRKLAEAQVELLNEFYDVDENYMVSEVSMAVNTHSLGILKAIVRGRLSIDETDEGIKITQTLDKPVGEVSQLVYHEIGSKEASAVERAEGKEVLYAMISSATNTDAEIIKKFGRVDKSTCEDLGNYFLFV